MRDQDKTKPRLIEDLAQLRRRLAQLEGIEEALRASEERYRGSFQDCPVPLWEEDFADVKAYLEDLRHSGVGDFGQHFDAHPDAVRKCATMVNVIDVNQATLDFYGAQSKDDLAKGLPLIFDEKSYEVFKDQLVAIAEGQTQFDAESSAVTLHGDRRNVALRWSVVRGYEETLSRVVVSDIDLTERKRAEQALQQLMQFNESIIQSMGEGVVVLDQEGDITFTNPSAEFLLGYQAEELVGHHWTHIVPPNQQPVIEEAVEHQAQVEDQRFELEVKRRDGTRIPVLSSINPRFENAYLAGKLWVFSDIADRKRAEEALKQYSGRLEEMVEDHTRQLRDAQKELSRKERLAVLGELAAGVSHELRNPLATITNAVYFLEMTLTDADETTREYLQLIGSQIRSASKIVSDLLDLSRDTTADRYSTPLPPLIDRLWHECVPPDNLQVATLLPPDLPLVYVDPQQMRQVLENLVINAYQAMPDGGTLTIEAKASRDEVRLSIADTGVGIAKQAMGKLFEPLFSTKPRGIGLGLAVSKTLVEANGGSIEVESEEGKGSTFTLILPVAEDEG
jgi:PAS domain S-box-containing protein